MKFTVFPAPVNLPLAAPILLTALAGFVDACTFLGLFGFFVAQLTGSYVLIGSEPAVGWPATVAVIAAPTFFVGGIMATLAATAGQAVGCRPLTAALALETLLLTGFGVAFSAVPLLGAAELPVVTAAMFGLAAMGVQSAAVRLLMNGVISTNVMTATTTQIAVDTTQLALTWLHPKTTSADEVSQRDLVRRRLTSTLPVPFAFLFGTMVGATAFQRLGYPVLIMPVVLTAVLTLWAMRWEGKYRHPRSEG